MHSLYLARALESQLTSEQSLTGRHWNSPNPHSRTGDNMQWDSRRDRISIKSNLMAAGWMTHKQSSTHWSEGSEPHIRLPNLDIWQWKEEFLESQTSKAGRIWLRDFNRTGESRDSTLGGHAQSSVCIRTQGRERWPHGRLKWTYLLVLEGILQRQGVVVAHRRDKDTGSRSSGKYSLVWALPESAISPTKEPGRLQCWVTSGQATNKEGMQPHPTADKQIKVLLSSAHQSNTKLYPPPVPHIRKLAQAS